jgi:hypothetical protein
MRSSCATAARARRRRLRRPADRAPDSTCFFEHSPALTAAQFDQQDGKQRVFDTLRAPAGVHLRVVAS